VTLKKSTSREDAQRKVTRFVILEIGDRLYGGNPEGTRDQEGRTCWSVPVILTLPDKERRKVGKILVDATTGQIQITDNIVSSITAKAERLASQPTQQKGQTANQAS
jgi:hypothetical protein